MFLALANGFFQFNKINTFLITIVAGIIIYLTLIHKLCNRKFQADFAIREIKPKPVKTTSLIIFALLLLVFQIYFLYSYKHFNFLQNLILYLSLLSIYFFEKHMYVNRKSYALMIKGDELIVNRFVPDDRKISFLEAILQSSTGLITLQFVHEPPIQFEGSKFDKGELTHFLQTLVQMSSRKVTMKNIDLNNNAQNLSVAPVATS